MFKYSTNAFTKDNIPEQILEQPQDRESGQKDEGNHINGMVLEKVEVFGCRLHVMCSFVSEMEKNV